MQVKIRGVTYPTVRHAARALNVTPNAIYSALERGRVDYTGLPEKSTKPIPVTINGVTYPSQNQARKAEKIGWEKIKKNLEQDK